MRDHSSHIQLTRFAALELFQDALEKTGFRENAIKRRDRVVVSESFGRKLAEDIHSKTDIPNVLTCCMDSVALKWDIIESLNPENIPDTTGWVRGDQWEFANTGIAMPAGFDTAIAIENVEVANDEQSMQLKALPKQRFGGTRAKGETRKQGDLVVPAGTRITPDVAAAICGAGYSSVLVEGKPRVAFLPTGNELVPPNLPLSEGHPSFYAGTGHVFESNSVLAKGKIEAWHGQYVPFDIVPDDYDAIKNALLKAVEVADIVVINAGSSKGSDDWSVEVLEEIGTVVCHQMAHGPGHHSFMGIINDTPVIGISGPPGGASFAMKFYLKPLIKAWCTGCWKKPPTVKIPLRGSFGVNVFAKKNMVGNKNAPTRDDAELSDSKFSAIRYVEMFLDENGAPYAVPLDTKDMPLADGWVGIVMLDSGPEDEFPQDGDILFVESQE